MIARAEAGRSGWGTGSGRTARPPRPRDSGSRRCDRPRRRSCRSTGRRPTGRWWLRPRGAVPARRRSGRRCRRPDRARQRPTASAQSSPFQPRVTCRSFGSWPRSSAINTWASMPSSPAAVSAATCPSPRCSRSVVHNCQSARTGSPGKGNARFAANNGRPAPATRSVARASPSFTAAATAAIEGSNRTSVAAAASARASTSVSGVSCDQTSGTQRATNAGAKLKNVASTTGALTAPIGAPRKPK